MLKDTKSLGNNKAPACESRGFVLKKEGVLFDTPSSYFQKISYAVNNINTPITSRLFGKQKVKSNKRLLYAKSEHVSDSEQPYKFIVN